MSSVLSRRPRSGPILRVRTGCLTCRTRKKKCDERKPCCRGCERNNLECRWAPSSHPLQRHARTTRRQGSGLCDLPPTTSSAYAYIAPAGGNPLPDIANPSQGSSNASIHDVHSPQQSGSELSSGSSTSPSSSSTTSLGNRTTVLRPDPIIDTSDPTIGITSEFNELVDPVTSTALPDTFDLGSSQELALGTLQAPLGLFFNLNPKVHRNLNLLPGSHGSDSFELLSHYMAVTTMSMANGSTEENPFLVQLVPLAFGHDLILQLILTQSAVHRATRSTNSTDQLAGQYYSNSLQLFQQNITKYIGGQTFEETLVLGVAALIMCFVETAKGDVNGTVFDHLMAAQSLLRPCLTATSSLPLRLRNFLTEYYVYTATLSMISIDPSVSPQLFLTDELRDLANELVATGYIGNMCGCWLELILLIPSIFDLCRQLTPVDDQQPTTPTADHFVTFAQLHSSILNWTPGLPLDQEVFLAGRAFQQAILLYLHTALGAFSKQQDGQQSASIQSAITEALSVLAQLDSTSRINTSLCWPIAVVGSCLTDAGQKAFLTGRLEQMFTSIGLGNIRQTSNLLERMWATSVTGDGPEAGPWSICRVMHENQIWISFA